LPFDPERLTRSCRLLAAAYLLLGLAHLALLPPWEGFDEFAHYSYIQQVADQSRLPRMADARVSRAVERYAASAPLPYAARPPFDRNGGITYAAFRGQTPAFRRAASDLVHRPPTTPRRFERGATANWQAQHPPLYYVALAPVHRATRHWSWAAHLFALRGASFLLAWLAWGLAVRAGLREAARTGEGRWQWAAVGTALWPLAWPAWFPGFARLGNDSLAALFATALWLACLHLTRRGLSTRGAALLGAIGGAGALTKVTFLPVMAGLAGYWAVRARRRDGRPARTVAARIAILIAVAATLAAPWYLREPHPYLVPLWPDEVAALDASGGLFGALAERFTLGAWLRAQAALGASFAWSGTWSLALPPYVFLAPLALAALLAAGGSLARLRRTDAGDVAWLPWWMALPLLAALEYHVVVRIALVGAGLTPGYYLHALVAPLGAALGLALESAWRRRSTRRLALGLAGYAVAFAAVVSVLQVLMFAGRLAKAGGNRFYQATEPWPSLLDPVAVLRDLRPLAHPEAGAAAWLLGGALLLAGAAAAVRSVRRSALHC
jgi:hypothetical protein